MRSQEFALVAIEGGTGLMICETGEVEVHLGFDLANCVSRRGKEGVDEARGGER